MVRRLAQKKGTQTIRGRGLELDSPLEAQGRDGTGHLQKGWQWWETVQLDVLLCCLDGHIVAETRHIGGEAPPAHLASLIAVEASVPPQGRAVGTESHWSGPLPVKCQLSPVASILEWDFLFLQKKKNTIGILIMIAFNL